jgi:hypothetical protein
MCAGSASVLCKSPCASWAKARLMCADTIGSSGMNHTHESRRGQLVVPQVGPPNLQAPVEVGGDVTALIALSPSREWILRCSENVGA